MSTFAGLAEDAELCLHQKEKKRLKQIDTKMNFFKSLPTTKGEITFISVKTYLSLVALWATSRSAAALQFLAQQEFSPRRPVPTLIFLLAGLLKLKTVSKRKLSFVSTQV